MNCLVGMVFGIIIGVIWSFSSLDAETLHKINTVCSNNQQVEGVAADLNGNIHVRCNDGTTFNIDKWIEIK